MAFPAPFGIAGRDEVIAAVADGTNWDESELDEVRVTHPAPGTAVVVYRASARRGENAYRCYAGSVYVERDGSWKLAFHQQTPIGD
jgi:hypothetical protein